MNSRRDLNSENTEKKTSLLANIVKLIRASFEGLLVTILIFFVIMMVISSFFEEQFGLEEEEETYSYSDYNDYDYREFNYEPEPLIPKNNTITAEDIMNSATFNKILKETSERVDRDNNSTNIEITDFVVYKDLSVEDFEEAKKKIIVTKEGLSVDEEVIISLKNKNDSMMRQIDVYAIFYFGNDIVEIQNGYVDILMPNSIYYLKFEQNEKEYDSYEIFLSKDYEHMDETTFIDKKIDYMATQDDDKIMIDYKNNSQKDLGTVRFTILYYNKNNEIIDLENNLFNEESEDEGRINTYTSRKNDYNSYKVILNYAIAKRDY